MCCLYFGDLFLFLSAMGPMCRSGLKLKGFWGLENDSTAKRIIFCCMNNCLTLYHWSRVRAGPVGGGGRIQAVARVAVWSLSDSSPYYVKMLIEN